MSVRLLFRCDCNGTTGLGHFSRCLNLARVLSAMEPSAQVVFWGSYDDFARILLERYQIARLDEDINGFTRHDAPATLSACRGFDAIIVDTYAAEQDYVDALTNGSCKFVFMDDMRMLDLSDADLVICFRANAETMPYGARQEALGLAYLVVKPELRAIRLRNLTAAPRPINRVLTFFSGRDANSAMLAKVVAATAKALPDATVSYISSEGEKLLDLPNVKPLARQAEIEMLYADTDLVLTGGGLMKYESAYCGIPNATLSQTDLQDEDTQALTSRNLTFNLGLAANFNPALFTRELAHFATDSIALVHQRQAFRNAIATDSTTRLAELLLSL